MILLIDNYDSFTYNLYQFIGIFNSDIKVVRNDKITIEEIEELDPESDRKSTRLNSSHYQQSRMPSSA